MDTLPHDTRQWMPAYALTMEVATTLLLGTRLYSRLRHAAGSPGLDDVFITLSWITSTVSIALIIEASYNYGFNRHLWDVPPAVWTDTILYTWCIGILFLFSTTFTKISVLLFYRRLAKNTYSQSFKYAIWSAIFIIIVYTIVCLALLLTGCTPLDSTWMQVVPGYTKPWHCKSTQQQISGSLFGGSMSVITDFYSVVLPAVLLLRIKMTKRQKIGLVFIFGLGFLVVAAGILRTIYLSRVQTSAVDKTWITFNVCVAGIAESKLGIICACAPSLRKYFRHFFDHSSSNGSRDAFERGRDISLESDSPQKPNMYKTDALTLE